MRRIGTADEIAGLAAFFASPFAVLQCDDQDRDDSQFCAHRRWASKSLNKPWKQRS
jgi:hypothetical protein